MAVMLYNSTMYGDTAERVVFMVLNPIHIWSVNQLHHCQYYFNLNFSDFKIKVKRKTMISRADRCLLDLLDRTLHSCCGCGCSLRMAGIKVITKL